MAERDRQRSIPGTHRIFLQMGRAPPRHSSCTASRPVALERVILGRTVRRRNRLLDRREMQNLPDAQNILLLERIGQGNVLPIQAVPDRNAKQGVARLDRIRQPPLWQRLWRCRGACRLAGNMAWHSPISVAKIGDKNVHPPRCLPSPYPDVVPMGSQNVDPVNPVVHPPDNGTLRSTDRNPVFADSAARIAGARRSLINGAAVAAVMAPTTAGDDIVDMPLGSIGQRPVERQGRQAMVAACPIDVVQNLLGNSTQHRTLLR